VKGLYNKARQGVIKDFTGINSPYESPIKPELTINTSSQTLEESVESVLSFLSDRGLIRDQH
jgi:adenylylsulfate kinase-like enzyme